MTTAATAPRAATTSAARRAWATPAADSGRSSPPDPLNRRATVCSVTPWRSSDNVTGVPTAPDQPRAVPTGLFAVVDSATPPSRAALSSRSACLFCSRGTQT